MEKLAILLALGAVGFPSLAKAADIVTVDCNPFFAGQTVSGSQASAGVTLPPSCKASESCSQCIADLLASGFKEVNSFAVANNKPTTSDAYFLFKRGGAQ
jgi:ferredoxin